MSRPSFETVKEYLNWADERHELLKEIYKPVLEAFDQIANEEWEKHPESEKWSWIMFTKHEFEEGLSHRALLQMEKLPGADRVFDKESREFVWRSGGAQSAIGYQEFESPYSTRIIQKDKNGEVLFEEIKEKF